LTRTAKNGRRWFGIQAPDKGPVNIDPIKAAEIVKGWARPHTPGLLTPQELKKYFEDGFVLKHNVFTPQDLQPSIDSVNDMVDELAMGLYKAGRIKDPCKSAGFTERLTLVEKQYPSASVIIHKRGVLPMSFARLWSHPKLVSVAKQVLGPDVAGHPVWNLRAKTPGQTEAVVPWHQDTAYMDSHCWNVLQFTAWLPLVHATKASGCMEVIRGGHKTGLTAMHTGCWNNTWYVELSDATMERELKVNVERDTVLCEVPLGSVLFINNILPHRSLPNVSNDIRWSLDLRWHDPAFPNGLWGLKDSVLMTKRDDPNFQPDWTNFMNSDRNRLQQNQKSDDKRDEFDTVLFGPWMGTWPLTNRNRHTDAFENAERERTRVA